ncbi:hypothetical protein [Sulfuriflexus mobilis]|nr:hypothetical protein [Sulfuriflexus mobilis]
MSSRTFDDAGSFFWRNKGFQEHARETGLANMPQTGVVPDAH